MKKLSAKSILREIFIFIVTAVIAFIVLYFIDGYTGFASGMSWAEKREHEELVSLMESHTDAEIERVYYSVNSFEVILGDISVIDDEMFRFLKDEYKYTVREKYPEAEIIELIYRKKITHNNWEGIANFSIPVYGNDNITANFFSGGAYEINGEFHGVSALNTDIFRYEPEMIFSFPDLEEITVSNECIPADADISDDMPMSDGIRRVNIILYDDLPLDTVCGFLTHFPDMEILRIYGEYFSNYTPQFTGTAADLPQVKRLEIYRVNFDVNNLKYFPGITYFGAGYCSFNANEDEIKEYLPEKCVCHIN